MSANASFNDVQAPLAPDEGLLRTGSRKITIRLLPLLLIGYLVSYIDRTNLGFAALTMNQAIGLTATQFGIAGGAFYVGSYCWRCPATSSCNVSAHGGGWPASWSPGASR